MATYSFLHRAQISSTCRCTRCHLFRRPSWMWLMFGSGSKFSGWLMMKCPGVRASYESTDDDSWHNGREFKHASICVKTVESSSYVSVVFPSTARRCFLKLFTAASQIPPMWGADGVMNFHFIFRSERYRLTAWLNSGDCRCSRMFRGQTRFRYKDHDDHRSVSRRPKMHLSKDRRPLPNVLPLLQGKRRQRRNP